jgi:preprotein translocase subunit SecA
MFAAMMDAIKEESVGFLFNLEVEVDDDSAAAADADVPVEPTSGDANGALSDPEKLVADIAAGRNGKSGEQSPHISAKGLDRSDSRAALTYSAPALDSDAPDVHTEDGGSAAGGGPRAAAARQRRANPNRGARGNKRKR